MFDSLSHISEAKRESFGKGLTTFLVFLGIFAPSIFFGLLIAPSLPYFVASGIIGAVVLFCLLLKLKLATVHGHGHTQKYEAILTGVESRSISNIAEIVGLQAAQVRSEIQRMIDSGVVSDFFIDHSRDEVVSTKYLPKTAEKTVVICSQCGKHNQLILGITKFCTACGQALVLQR